MFSDSRSAVTCGSRTQRDAMRRNSGAWRADGGGPGPISVSVRVTNTSTYSSAIFRAAPGRGMPQPSLRRSVNCTRYS
jgi:hypothetical protein